MEVCLCSQDIGFLLRETKGRGRGEGVRENLARAGRLKCVQHYIRMCIIFAHAFTCIHIFIYTYIYVHIYIYIYALTLTHTDAKKIGEVVEEMAGARLIYRYIYTYTFTNTYTCMYA